MPTTFEWLQAAAPDFGAALVASSAGAEGSISIQRPSGVYTYRLDLRIAGERVSAKEAGPDFRLPRFCPDRHINSDGSFCLGWGEDNPSLVVDEPSAKRWWSALYRFLSQQATADYRHIFPGRFNGRAHGDAAAHQADAEALAAHFGEAFARRVHLGTIAVREDFRPGKRRLELWDGERRIVRMSQKTGLLVGAHPRCPCGSGSDVLECGTHGADLAELIKALHMSGVKESQMLEHFAKNGAQCCGTLRECGLRRAIETHNQQSTTKKASRGRHSKFWRAPTKSKGPR